MKNLTENKLRGEGLYREGRRLLLCAHGLREDVCRQKLAGAGRGGRGKPPVLDLPRTARTGKAADWIVDTDKWLERIWIKEGENTVDGRLTLEKRIEAELKSYDGIMSVYADDFHGNVISMGADEQFETASTIKTYILACLFDEVEKGNADLDSLLTYKEEHFVDGSGVLRALETGAVMRVRDIAALMIIVSDNIATNMMIDYLGLDRINQCIRRLGCRDTVLHNPIHFEKYERLGTTTVRDYASLFIRLTKGELISERSDRQMVEILKKQHYNSMLVKDFPPVYMDSDNTDDILIEVASKSGSMDACRNDGGIIYTPYGPYVLVMFNKEFSDAMYYPAHPATMFGARVSRMLLDQFLALEGRFAL